MSGLRLLLVYSVTATQLDLNKPLQLSLICALLTIGYARIQGKKMSAHALNYFLKSKFFFLPILIGDLEKIISINGSRQPQLYFKTSVFRQRRDD